MPLVDVIDETFIVAPPSLLAGELADGELWRRWWPGLELTVFQDRGERGIRWTVTGELVGTSEVWLEAFADGTIVHYFLRADPAALNRDAAAPAPRTVRRAQRVRRDHVVAVKRNLNALKDRLEQGRPPGTPAWDRTPSPGSSTAPNLPRSDR